MKPCGPSPTVDYYHKVVDCQYACPAHTDVPEYIRLIAQERYREAYLVNRESNLFPGILGRVCDRPCEPVCRRKRVDGESVAICRLKRFAAGQKGDLAEFLPKPAPFNGFKVALVGGGAGCLTIANDLLIQGFKVHLFERDSVLGGAIRRQIPAFRLPSSVVDEEISMIEDMGLSVTLGHTVDRISDVLATDFSAVVIGTGAPKGRGLDLGDQPECLTSYIGVEFLPAVSFRHLTKLEGRVVVIGGGNTAMDCARTAKRLGAELVSVIAPESYSEMFALEWEKQDTLAEGIFIENNLLPSGYSEDGIQFRSLLRCYDKDRSWNPVYADEKSISVPCEHVIFAIGQTTQLDLLDEDCGVEIQDGYPILKEGFQSTNPKIFFVGDCAKGPSNIITAVAQGHQVAKEIQQLVLKEPLLEPAMKLTSRAMTPNQWSYANDFDDLSRRSVEHLDQATSLSSVEHEVELGFSRESALKEAKRCLNCDVQTVFYPDRCIECDACVDICPVDCLVIEGDTPKVMEEFPSDSLKLKQEIPMSRHHMHKDEDICLHCGLCSERCPTKAWDMQKFTLTR